MDQVLDYQIITQKTNIPYVVRAELGPVQRAVKMGLEYLL